MKFTKELLKKSEDYCFRLGLDNRLLHIPKTKIQADILHKLQLDSELTYRDDYFMVKSLDIHDQSREAGKATRLIEALQQHLYDHYVPLELDMIAELTLLQNRLNMDDRVKPKRLLNGILSDMEAELKEAGFSNTNIKLNILPVLVNIIKNIDQ